MNATTTKDARIEALAGYLDIMAEEIRADGDNRYTVNPRNKMHGMAPREYMQNAHDFRQLLTVREAERLTKAINEISKDGPLERGERDELYNFINNRIKNRIAKTEAARKAGDLYRSGIYRASHLEAIERLKKAAGYVENVLFHLLESEGNNTHGVDYRMAWSGRTPDDHRQEWEVNDGEYLVLTEDEAETAHEEALEQWLDEIVTPELDENVAKYFDREAWKRDARLDGRGHALSQYDGEEISAGEFCIFRTN